MDATSGEWVIYHPPKSVGFGHQSRIRDPRRAWPATERFLGDLTRFSHGRHRIEIECEAPEAGVDIGVAEARAKAAREAFGREDPGSYAAAPRWTLDPSQLAAAIRFALDDDKFPKQPIGPTRLHFAYEFSWTEFEQLPYRADGGDVRHRSSLLGIFLGGQRLFLAPLLVFPAPWDSYFLREFIARIEPIVPFRFRDQYFQRSLPIRGEGRVGRRFKLHKDWRKATSGPVLQ